MKKIFILLLLAFGLAGCETFNRAPYSGSMGDYGFTYDLNNSPSPFVDTSYRPLTPFDLAAPIIVVVTNQPPTRFVYEPSPSAGVIRYEGETPARAIPSTTSPTIVEPAGAQANQGTGAAGTTGAVGGAPAYGGSGYGYGGNVTVGGTNVVSTNTNQVVTNITSTNVINLTNTNVFGFVTNTNGFGVITNTNVVAGGTNTNAFAGGTNRVINEPAGAQLQTNRPPGEPAAPPQGGATNDASLNQPVPQPQAPASPPAFQTPPPQRPADQPPASAPQNPPTPTTP